MIYGGLTVFGTIVCAETMGPVVALFSGFLLSSLSSSVSYSSLFTILLIVLDFSGMMCKLLEVIISIKIMYYPGQSSA